MATPAPSCSSSSPAHTFIYNQDLATEMQMKWIITSDLPFHIFDNDLWTEFVQTALQPRYERVSTTTIKRLAFKHYLKARKELINYFQHFEGGVSLTIQVWNTIYMDWYDWRIICITCHWIDPVTWKMSKRVIGLETFPAEANDIYDVIKSCILEFNIKDKILSITFGDDDAGLLTKVMEMLKREVNPAFNGIFFHTKCARHVINSMVQSTLDHVGPIISKFENMFLYVYRSERRREFKKFVHGKGAKYSEPRIHNPTQWNTTYKMLDGIVKRKSLLVEYYAKCGQHDIDNNDWEIIESLLGILEVFRSSTIVLSDANNPTTPLLLGETLLIANMFKQYKQHPFWQPLILEMRTKFLRYYETMPPIYSCAAVLNPTLGVGGVENILEDIEVNLGLDMNNNNYATASITKCCAALQEVFDYYDIKYRSSRTRELVPITSASRNIIRQSVTRKKSKAASISNELELYTKTDFSNLMTSDEYESLNMLEWWRNKGVNQYPILATMARDILTIQASSVALEYAFYLNGRVLEEKSNELSSQWLLIRHFLKEHFDTIEAEAQNNVNLGEDSSEESEEFEDSSEEE